MEQQAAGRGQSSIWAGLTNHSPVAASIFTPETQALVSVDFPDEDEDEEYKPEADDQVSSSIWSAVQLIKFVSAFFLYIEWNKSLP